MKREWAVFVGAFLLSFQMGAEIDGDRRAYVSGNDLLTWCKEIEEDGNTDACLSYVAGVSDTLAWQAIVYRESIICRRRDVTQGQLGRIVLEFLREHPDDLEYAASSLVRFALTEAFPCKDEKAPE
jgi:hypothetical protein